MSSLSLTGTVNESPLRKVEVGVRSEEGRDATEVIAVLAGGLGRAVIQVEALDAFPGVSGHGGHASAQGSFGQWISTISPSDLMWTPDTELDSGSV